MAATPDQPAPPGRPVGTGEIDALLAKSLRQQHRVRWTATIAALIMLGAAVIGLAVVVVSERQQVTAGCGFFRSLTGLPVVPPAPQKAPSRFAVTLIADSRAAYDGLGCGSPAPPASPSERRWAAYYHVRLP